MATQFTVSARLTTKDEASPKIKQAEGSFRRFANFIGRGFVTAMRSGAVALTAATAAVQSWARAAAEQEDAVNTLNAALARLGDQAGGVSEALQQQAAALQQVTRYGDEQIIQAQALLVTLGVQKDRITEATQATVDLAAAFGLSLESAARNVGRTMGGFAGELGEIIPELRNLSAESLKAGEGIEVIANAVSGRAAADAKTFSGQIAQLGNTFGDLNEKLGATVTENDGLRDSIAKLNEVLARDETAETLRSVAEAVLLIGNAALGAVNSIGAFGRAIGDLIGPDVEQVLENGALSMEALKATADRLGITVEELRVRIANGANATRAMNAEMRETAEASEAAEAGVQGLTIQLERSERIARDNAKAMGGFKEAVEALGVVLEEEANEAIEENNRLLEEADDLYRRGLITRRDYEALERRVAEVNVEVAESLKQENDELERFASNTGIATDGLDSFTESTRRSTTALRERSDVVRTASEEEARYAKNLAGGRSDFATIGGGTFSVDPGETRRRAGLGLQRYGINRV